MRVLNRPYIILFLLVVALRVDTILTQVINAVLDLPVHLSSHLFLVLFSYALNVLSYRLLGVGMLLLGMGYDSYFFDFYPIMLLIFPLMAHVGKLLTQRLRLTIFSRVLFLIISAFTLEVGSYSLAYLYGLTTYRFLPFIIGTLAPSLLFVTIEFFLIVPLLEKLRKGMS